MDRISYNDFKENLAKFGVFKLSDIRKIYPKFDQRRLVEWQQKRYIKKIISGCYIFNQTTQIKDFSEIFLWLVSNKILGPSYISMETALSYYNFIKEGVFTVTAVSSVRTSNISTDLGYFKYNKIKPQLFFGYKIISLKLLENNLPIKFATPEKALLDYFYFNTKIRDLDDINELRFNNNEIISTIDQAILADYQLLFDNTVLNRKIKLLFKSF